MPEEDNKHCNRGGPKSLMNETVGKSFLTAVLLGGCVKQAEMAVLEGIQSLSNGTDPYGDALQINAASAGVRQRYGRTGAADTAKASLLLPAELRRVLRLPTALRQCFVLRLLMVLPRELTAEILGQDVEAVDRHTARAAQALAQAAQRETGDKRNALPDMPDGIRPAPVL
jgi:hypothetical protein